MDNLLFSTVLAFIITFFSIPVIIQVAKQKKLFDEPDERKVHKTVIPTLGGLGIFAGFIFAILMCTPPGEAQQLQFFAAAAVVMFFLGLKDDILVISASKKFVGQLIAAGIIIKFGGVHLTSMGGFMGIEQIPVFAGNIFTVFTIIVVTNSFNLIDGVDGLAGSLGMITATVFGAYFYFSGHMAFAVMGFALAGSLLSFLIYNFSPAKIFMGDTGSLLLGLINSILVIKFISVASAPDAIVPLPAAPAIGFAILLIPLVDTLRVFGLRILDRRSPFSPDRNHVHHFLLDIGLNHRQITMVCASINVTLIVAAYFLRHLGTNVLIGLLLLAAFSLTSMLYYLRHRSKQMATPQPKMAEPILKARKILTLVPETIEAD